MHDGAVAGDLAPGRIDDQAAEPDRPLLWCRCTIRAPKERPDARDELARAERLRHVVVRADPEPDLEIRLRVSSREHQDRNVAFPLDLAADLEAIEPGEHQVEDDEVRTEPAADVDAGKSVAGDLDLEPLGAQPRRDGRGA